MQAIFDDDVRRVHGDVMQSKDIRLVFEWYRVLCKLEKQVRDTKKLASMQIGELLTRRDKGEEV